MANWLDNLLGETQVRLLRLLRRSRQTITGLSEQLRLTDNAVRTHIAALRRDGLVEDVGAQRDTGGKPARIYGLTRDGEELFPKVYAAVLGLLLEELVRRHGRERATEMLRAVGARLAARSPKTADLEQRVQLAARLFEQLGTDVAVQGTADGWRLQGYGCPLSSVTAEHEEACELGRALVAEVTGALVTERCERGPHPRCAFAIAS